MALASLTSIPPSPKPKPPLISKSHHPSSPLTIPATTTLTRRNLALSFTLTGILLHSSPVLAVEDEEYTKETTNVINKLRSTINMDRKDPNIAASVAELREASNTWVAKYRREKALLGRASFRDVYSALNAVSGHYISFGPTAPIPVKRKSRILEEVETAEKALLRGR